MLPGKAPRSRVKCSCSTLLTTIAYKTDTTPMKRRNLLQLGLISGLFAIILGTATAAPARPPEVAEASVAELQTAMSRGTLTSRQLVTMYLARIKSIDKAGPKINSIIELNPIMELILGPALSIDLMRARYIVTSCCEVSVPRDMAVCNSATEASATSGGLAGAAVAVPRMIANRPLMRPS